MEMLYNMEVQNINKMQKILRQQTCQSTRRDSTKHFLAKTGWFWVAIKHTIYNEISLMAPRLVRIGVRSRRLSCQSLDGWPKIYYLKLLRASEGTLSRWARVVGYGPFSLCVIYKEGLCLSSGGINRLIWWWWSNIRQSTRSDSTK
jgi:hypothetical protein